jgi:small-conductance mechanosensitive channel
MISHSQSVQRTVQWQPTRVLVSSAHVGASGRLKVPVRVPHDSDLDQALALMREAASCPERVLAVPAPNALIMAFGESAIELELRFWIEDAQNGVHNVKSQVLYEIWRLFQQQGIRIPYPKRDLYVRSDAPATLAEVGDRQHRRP